MIKNSILKIGSDGLVRKFLVLVFAFLLIVGCKDDKISNEVKYKTINNNYTFISIKESDKNKNLKVKTTILEEDYTKIILNSNKAVAYEIDLINEKEKISKLDEKIKVGVLIPDDFDENNLMVYYVENEDVKETFDVEVEMQNNVKYATFTTSHFSTYVLVEIKNVIEGDIEASEKEPVDDVNGPSQNTSSSNNVSNNTVKDESSNVVNDTAANNNVSSNSVPSEPNFDAVPQHQVTIIPTAINVPEGAKIPELPTFTHPFRAEISQTEPIHAEVNFSYCQIGVLCHVYYNYEDNWYGEPVKQLPKNFTYILEPLA